jgi:hypothetical protein
MAVFLVVAIILIVCDFIELKNQKSLRCYFVYYALIASAITGAGFYYGKIV